MTFFPLKRNYSHRDSFLFLRALLLFPEAPVASEETPDIGTHQEKMHFC